MIELDNVFSMIYNAVESDASKLGFKPVIPDGLQKGETPVFKRDEFSSYLQYYGEKGALRVLFSENKIRLLAADAGAKSEDDSDYNLIASFLLDLNEYDEKSAKSVANEVAENITETYTPKQIAKRQQNVKAQPTVTRSQVKNGDFLYDPVTLAIRLGGMYPDIKSAYKTHVEKYDEFLCEDFFVNVVNPLVFETIKSGEAQKMKKLFGILNEFYDDGSNETQDVIVVTMLASYDYTPEMLEKVLGYVNDSLMEPFIIVNKILKKSKSARMRLENPPAYKPKKQSKKKKTYGLNNY